MADNDDQLVLNSISARALKIFFTSKINDIVDELVTKKYPQKKKPLAKRIETRIPIDLIREDFVKRFKLDNYKNGILSTLINSLVENNYFSKDGKLNDDAINELVINDIEKKILEKISKSSSLYIDVSDVKILSSRLKKPASFFIFNKNRYVLENDKIEELINQLAKNNDITLDEKYSVKDNVYILSDELLEVLKSRLFKCPQVKDNLISKTRLYDYFNRITKQEESKIYVILKDKKIADILGIDTIKIGSFIYTKHSMLMNSISSNVDRYSKKFQESFYEKISEFVKDNEKVNVSKVVECLITPNIVLDAKLSE
ncbi:DNA-binding core protein [Goatpox virus]|uniref:DNA-binding core protein n=1 Tax=Goatpox virus TaxID=186805 RepID=A0A5C0PSE7_9POXV|nr:DNA-binding core protein [Goatpox virus]QEJ79341.1 DNA-binding core protein [Goatpox virus]QEJ79491.1 DNA-binding core protein [Goatpox virus]